MIALILARGGSKGIPKKNLQLVGEKPILEHLIDNLKKTKKITDIYVSSDSEEILEVSKKCNVKTIQRPSEFASDNSKDIDSFKHAISVIGYVNEIAHFRPTTPFICPEIVDKAIEVFNSNIKNCTSLRSGHELTESLNKFYKMKKGFFVPLFKEFDTKDELPRQLSEKYFVPNGYVDIVKPEIFMTSNSFYGKKILPYITEFTQEIDTLEDLDYIRYIHSKQNA
jgi:CMP-N,N'-diacetyllegionaminic acid synthase